MPATADTNFQIRGSKLQDDSHMVSFSFKETIQLNSLSDILNGQYFIIKRLSDKLRALILF